VEWVREARDLQKKDRVLRVRLGEDEYPLLKAFAESHGTTMPALLRSFIRAMRQLDERGKTIIKPLATAPEP
jgi:hypothetical protein